MAHILIVEDDTVFRLTLRKILESRFPLHSIDEAEDGAEALSKIHFGVPDIIIMDINMPGENGLELTRKVKSIYPDAVVVILTSYDLPEYRQAAIEKGANHFFSKHTTSTAELLSLVAKF